jgi:hypothetical protein
MLASVEPERVKRVCLTAQQTRLFKAVFARTESPSPQELDELSAQVGLYVQLLSRPNNYGSQGLPIFQEQASGSKGGFQDKD